MRITQASDKQLLTDKVSAFFSSKKTLTRWSIGLIALAGTCMLFFSILGYGAYLKKVGHTTYYKNTLLKIAAFDFTFLKNYATSHFSDLDEIKLDVKFKHLMRLKYLREQALKEGYILEAYKQEDFPAKLTYKGQTYSAKMGLTGLTTDHVVDPTKWSFQVKLKGDQTIKGVKRFGLLIPKARGYLTDWIAFELLKARGLMGLRVDFVDVSLNGKPLGIYYLEERFDKYLIESNRLREGIIFKIEENLKAYQEDKLMASAETRPQLLLVKRMWQDVMAGNLAPGQFFDLKKMASLFAITDLMNNKHPLYRGNLRFYFNPVTGLAEPIAREFGSLHKYESGKLAMWLEEAKPENDRHRRLQRDPFLRLIYDNLEFKQHYINEAIQLSRPELLDSLFLHNGDKMQILLSKVYGNWPFYEVPAKKLYENQQYMKYVLNPTIKEVTAYFEQITDDALSVQIRNEQYLPVDISHLSWRDSLIFYPDRPIILDSKDARNTVHRSYNFKMPSGLVWSDSLLAELKVYYNFYGQPPGEKSVLLFPRPHQQSVAESGNPVAKVPNYTSFPFVIEDPNTNILSIQRGEYILERDLILPADKQLEVSAGVRIDLINEARILSYGPVDFLGEESDPITIVSSDSTGRGLMVVRAAGRSYVNYTNFDRISCPKEDGWQLPGAVTFYESPVDIRNCTFSGNREGDDFLNIVRSDFVMEHATFRNILADAFDCDFCEGTITNSAFINVGNDAVDVSGTKLQIDQVSMNKIGDKGLSAGENSEVRAQWLDISNAELAITSKDQSRIYISDVKIHNSKIGFSLFQKKSEFGPAFISAERAEISKAEIAFLVEENSNMIIDGTPYISNKENVKDILYGVEYGKSSK